MSRTHKIPYRDGSKSSDSELNYKKYRVTFDSGDDNYCKMHIGDKNVNFPDNNDGIYLSKMDNICLRKVAEENKRNII